MRITTRNKLNNWEFISLRIGFSIYTGWVTAATILNAVFLLKSWGFKNPNAGLSENEWCPVLSWIAMVIYMVATFMERNPVYGIIFLWATAAIRDRHSEVPMIATQLLIILIVHALYIMGITGFCIREKQQGKCTRGIFY